MQDIVITGIGVISPIGIGSDAFWSGLCEGRSGIRTMDTLIGGDVPPPLAAPVSGFEPGKYVRPRKNLKVMSRDIQLGVAAAEIACNDAALKPGSVAPERVGVVYGADMIAAELAELIEPYGACVEEGRFLYARWGSVGMGKLFPLWMLKYLPNMPACHIAIAQDARGPNNSLTLADVSSLSAVAEAASVIRRGQADAMIAGGTSARIHPGVWTRFRAYQFSRGADPTTACRPFDADRDGMVLGEGAAAFILESRRHAEARGAKPLARILGAAAAFEPHRPNTTIRGDAIRQAIRAVLRQTGWAPADIGHVNAHGVSTPHDDRIEAQAIRDALGEGAAAEVPVTAIKSYVGNLGAASGVVEMAASILALKRGSVPPTLNYRRPDPQCPIHVVCGAPAPVSRPTALLLNHAPTGQAVAMAIAAE